ncbi:MAG: arginase family protein [Bacteroidota bacterium]
MIVFFPQLQCYVSCKSIEVGAISVMNYIVGNQFNVIPLSSIQAGNNGEKQYYINNYGAIVDQLGRLHNEIAESQPRTVQTIGGDCGLEIVPVSYLNQKYGNIGVIWFDAHADINRPCDSPSCNFHGMPLRTLLGEGAEPMNPLLFSTIEASQIHYIGLRDVDDAEQLRIDQDHIFAPNKLHIPSLVQTLQSKGIKKLYLHFDFDCLDPSDYDQTYYQVPNGITIQEAETCIKALQQNFEVIGTSVLESTAINETALAPITGIIDLLMKDKYVPNT